MFAKFRNKKPKSSKNVSLNEKYLKQQKVDKTRKQLKLAK